MLIEIFEALATDFGGLQNMYYVFVLTFLFFIAFKKVWDLFLMHKDKGGK